MNQQDKDILFKALCGYLPYELRVNLYNMIGEIKVEATPINRFQISMGFKDFHIITENRYVYYLDGIKPILRPLSDYLDINGKAMNELNIGHCTVSALELSRFAKEITLII